jgi:PAS domain S-box-containing protein
LEESELKYRKLVETANDAIFIANADTGIIIDANTSAVKLTGRPIYELIGLHYAELHPQEEREKARETFGKNSRDKGFMLCNVNILRKDGVVIPVEISASFTKLSNQSIVQGVFRDVRPQKEIEKQLKRSVHEKEVLLKEVHHRVKNNLQVIYGLLLLHSHSIKDEKALQVLKDSQNRIQSMALIHRNLYQKTGDMGHVNFKEYGENLVHDVFTSYGVNPEKIGYETDIREILLDIDRAIPCGLIVNELVSNVLKYAFPGSMTGRISVSFQAVKEDYILKVEDNGKGMPDVEDHNESCLGLELVNMLTQQLKGELEIQTEKGTSVRITFPQKR